MKAALTRGSPMARLVRALAMGLLLVVGAAGLRAQPTGGASYSFETREEGGARRTVWGMQWGPAPGASRGAVVLIHGSGGWGEHPVGAYARAFAAAGFTAFAVDSHGPRGIGSTADNQTQLSAHQMARDALAARRMLIDQGYAAQRMAVIGFSKGGYAAMIAADRAFLPDEAERFAAVMAFYPACMARPRAPRPASVVFMALGERDDYAGVKPCEELAAEFRTAGGSIEVKVYPDASHGWDGNPQNTQPFRLSTVENYSACTWTVEDDGSVTYQGKRRPNDTAFERELRNTCMRRGATVWTNLKQKDASTRDAVAFAERVLAAK